MTDEPKLYYYKDNDDDSPNKAIKIDHLSKLEKFDKIKFKVTSCTIKNKSKKEESYTFKCSDVKECDSWFQIIKTELDKAKFKTSPLSDTS